MANFQTIHGAELRVGVYHKGRDIIGRELVVGVGMALVIDQRIQVIWAAVRKSRWSLGLYARLITWIDDRGTLRILASQ